MQEKFYKLPKSIMENNKLSSSAKLIYVLLLDRLELSIKSKWVDEYGVPYMYFKKDGVADILGISRDTVTKAFKQLKNIGLVSEKRQGLGKPNIIYINKLLDI